MHHPKLQEDIDIKIPLSLITPLKSVIIPSKQVILHRLGTLPKDMALLKPTLQQALMTLDMRMKIRQVTRKVIMKLQDKLQNNWILARCKTTKGGDFCQEYERRCEHCHQSVQR